MDKIQTRAGASPDDSAESPDGVDLTLIRWTLSLTQLERLELRQDWVDGLRVNPFDVAHLLHPGRPPVAEPRLTNTVWADDRAATTMTYVVDVNEHCSDPLLILLNQA